MMIRRVFIFILLTFLGGCAMFRKTNKESTAQAKSSASKLESSQLVLKKAAKETQIYTYWSDSGFYQYQHIKEQIDQEALANLKVEEKQQEQHTVRTKTKELIGNWMYWVLLVLLAVCFYVVRKFILRKS